MNISSNLKLKDSEFIENNCINLHENGDCQLFIDKRTDLNPAFNDEDNENDASKQIIEKSVCAINDEVFWLLEVDFLRMTCLVEENMDDIDSRRTVKWNEVSNVRKLRFASERIPGEEKCELRLIRG